LLHAHASHPPMHHIVVATEGYTLPCRERADKGCPRHR
jgi:hypothetical protein